ncbi:MULTISPECIES: hypothetical protein [Agrobacterium]|uniref:Uncharacterized protein n=1 Tax=Agrobacterium genomosp. 2 str. CFBP 5494 TaxID=1183436 RepID=A0A9W5F293_9HYPH|nr:MULTISPECIES: hypothetical protein [Agrobacterium]MCZ7930577.1 hypothetical protein [Agrobacterium pusense]UXT92370.1 hypothetical protein FY130_21640 [Agrobacterium pusense]CUW97786.1 conserved hypothetical protein [Agrobacterium genomosp. 2 str. CFBP 5494]
MSGPVRISELGSTWFIDLDGTVFAHNGHLSGAGDQLLPGVREFWGALRDNDMVVIITARSEKYRGVTEAALRGFGLRYSTLIMDAPHGERILVNDTKPSGMRTAFAINVPRNAGLGECLVIRDPNL